MTEETRHGTGHGAPEALEDAALDSAHGGVSLVRLVDAGQTHSQSAAYDLRKTAATIETDVRRKDDLRAQLRRFRAL